MSDLESRIEALKSRTEGLKSRTEGLDDLKIHVAGSSSPFLPFLKNDLRYIAIAKEIIKDPEASLFFPPTTESIDKLVELIRKHEGIKRVDKVIERAIAKVDASE